MTKPKKEEKEKEIDVPELSDEERKKLPSIKDIAVNVKRYRGLIMRLYPAGANIKRWLRAFMIYLFGLNKTGYVRIRMIDPNGIEKEFIIPYKELVKYKKEVYYLAKKLRTTGAYNLSTFTFYEGFSAPVDMTKPTTELDAGWFTKLLDKARLDASLEKKAVVGGMGLFGGIGSKGVILIVTIIAFIIYYFAYGKQFLPLPGT